MSVNGMKVAEGYGYPSVNPSYSKVSETLRRLSTGKVIYFAAATSSLVRGQYLQTTCTFHYYIISVRLSTMIKEYYIASIIVKCEWGRFDLHRAYGNLTPLSAVAKFVQALYSAPSSAEVEVASMRLLRGGVMETKLLKEYIPTG